MTNQDGFSLSRALLGDQQDPHKDDEAMTMSSRLFKSKKVKRPTPKKDWKLLLPLCMEITFLQHSFSSGLIPFSSLSCPNHPMNKKKPYNEHENLFNFL